MIGDFPNETEIKDFKAELFDRGKIPQATEDLIKKFPKDMHPMT